MLRPNSRELIISNYFNNLYSKLGNILITDQQTKLIPMWLLVLFQFQQIRQYLLNQQAMLTIRYMQVLYKESALMESLLTHKTKIRLVINGTISYDSIEVPVKDRLAVWTNQTFPPIELPAGANSFSFEFEFSKNNEDMGKAKCVVVLGRNKKDCLDIANRQFQIVGKFLFQINWRVGQPQQIYNYSPNLLIKQSFYMTNAQTYPQLDSYAQVNGLGKPKANYNQDFSSSQHTLASEYRPPNLQKPYFKNTEPKPAQKTVDSTGAKRSGWLGGCFGCYGVMKTKKKMPFFVVQSIVIDESELPYASPCRDDPFPIQFYSRLPRELAKS